MIDVAGTNHFVTLMIFMSYSCILENRYVTYKSTYFPKKTCPQYAYLYYAFTKEIRLYGLTPPNM